MSVTEYPQLRQVAKVLKSNGTCGEVLMGFRGISPEDIDTQEPVFIPFDEQPVPFFITSFTRKGTLKAVVHLEGVDNLKDAEELVGSPVFIDINLLETEEGDGSPEDFTGWKICDASGATLGTVSGWEDIPGNPCLYVEKDGNQEVLIPLHEDFIVSINEEDRALCLKLPDGLL